MRILVLNEYFPPDASATALMAEAVVKMLSEHHIVTVLCGRPSYDPSERHPFYFFRREQKGNISVERVGSSTFARFRMWQRIWNYLTYIGLSVPRALFIKTDLVLAMTDPPFEGIVGAFVAWLKGKPLVYNIRDLYPEMAIAGSIVRASWWIRLWEALHRWALRRASRVIVLGEDTRERIIAKGIDPSCVVVVRDGVSGVPRVGEQEHPVTREIRSGFSFVVLHAGNLGFYGAWDTVIKAARLLTGDGVGFVFVGEGAQRETIKASAQGVERIKFLPFRPADQLPYVLSAGDLHLITIKHGLEGVVVPSKLYSTLAAGRPVLGVVPECSDVARIVQSGGCGVIVDPEDPQAVASVVRDLSSNAELLSEMARKARVIAEQFAMDKQLRLFVELIEHL